jgi:uncharacterized membrane protein
LQTGLSPQHYQGGNPLATGTNDIDAAESKETGRLEAFSDGVFAIAITLLVLDMHVPPVDENGQAGQLAPALLHQWPVYFAYVTSFLTVLIMWTNHHALFRHIARVNQPFLMLNGLLLMGVTLVPFPTALVSEYMGAPDAPVAGVVFSGTFVALACVFNLLWRYAAGHNRLLARDADPVQVGNISRQYAFGPLLYLACCLLALVSVPAMLVLYVLIALFFALPGLALRLPRRA